MFKFDLKSGYHHIGINILDSCRKLMVKLSVLLLHFCHLEHGQQRLSVF